MPVTLTPRSVANSLEELLDGAENRESFVPADSRSGSLFERVVIDGRPLVLKVLHLDRDFLMRAAGDIGCRPLVAFRAGLYDVAPQQIDHGIVGMAGNVGRNGWGAAILMEDLSAELASLGDVAFAEEEHAAYVDHLAALCAATWGWKDDVGLLPYPTRWTYFGHAVVDGERELGWPEHVPRIAVDGWQTFAERAPRGIADRIDELRRDVGPLAAALQSTPSCFLHGDWKAGNLGRRGDGRTILIDWVYVGEGPACHEIGWYLALNRAKLPHGESKERVLDDFHAALRRHGVDTSGWWERQLQLGLLGTVVQFGWEKAFGDDDELGWWCDRAAEGLARL